MVTMPQLTTPTISLSDSILSIEEVENAEYYDIYVDGVLKESVPAVSGYDLIAGTNGFDSGDFLGTGNACEYSLDNGNTWLAFEKTTYSAGETILSGITQIKFRITNAPFTHGADSYEISSTKLGLSLSIDGFSEDHYKVSNNFVLTEDIDDLYGYSFVD